MLFSPNSKEGLDLAQEACFTAYSRNLKMERRHHAADIEVFLLLCPTYILKRLVFQDSFSDEKIGRTLNSLLKIISKANISKALKQFQGIIYGIPEG